MASPFMISVSALSRYFNCPAAYDYHYKLERKQLPPYIQDGLDAHAILEGDDVYASERAIRYAAQLSKMEEDGEYTILDRERRQYVRLTDNITLVRVVDVLARQRRRGVLIDLKTASSDWEVVGDMAPKGAGFQAAGYLIPPEDPSPYKEWPTRIDFLVARDTQAIRTAEPGHVYSYNYNEDDVKNLIEAAEIIRWSNQKGYFPKNRGGSCPWCLFKEACYGTENWEMLYDTKEDKRS